MGDNYLSYVGGNGHRELDHLQGMAFALTAGAPITPALETRLPPAKAKGYLLGGLVPGYLDFLVNWLARLQVTGLWRQPQILIVLTAFVWVRQDFISPVEMLLQLRVILVPVRMAAPRPEPVNRLDFFGGRVRFDPENVVQGVSINQY
jgi:hypothetical protein